jgi:hypothetical protein
VAKPAIVGTSLFGHKQAIHAVSNGCTNHFNHPL